MRSAATTRLIAKVVFIAALMVDAVLLVRGGHDPHKLFGFRPFNESDTWRAEIVRVHADGSRVPVDDGTWEYDWDELVGVSKLARLGAYRHAAAGAPASLDFLDRALHWAMRHIRLDTDTVALEATVTLIRNGRAPQQIALSTASAGDE